MPFQDAINRDAARIQVDEQIRSLKSARNQLAPISQLHGELLEDVFKYVIGDNRLRDFPCVYEDSWTTIITTSHVCRHWRVVALNCASLWSRINFSKSIIMEEMLLRSRLSPLSVAIDDEVDHDINLIFSSSLSRSRLLDIERLQSIHFFLPQKHLYRLFNAMTGTSLSHLQALCIDVKTWIEPYGDFTVPAHIMSLPMPRLRTLYLGTCAIPWGNIQNCDSLVSLTLDNIITPSREQFFRFLASYPNLETLSLQHALPEPSNDPIPTVKLPKLSSCTIHEIPLPQCVDFQMHVSYPVSKARLDICTLDDGGVANISLAKDLIHMCEALSNRGPSSSLLFGAAYEDTPYILLSQLPFQRFPGRYSYTLSDDDKSSTSIDLTGTAFEKEEDSGLRWLELLSIPRLDMFVVDRVDAGMPDLDELQWRDFFERHPTITHLCIVSTAPGSILAALQTSVHDSKLDAEGGDPDYDGHRIAPVSLSTSRPLLPNLVELTLGGIDVDLTRNPAVFALLRRFLSKRREYGVQVQQLHIVGCIKMGDETLRILENEVGNLYQEEREEKRDSEVQ